MTANVRNVAPAHLLPVACWQRSRSARCHTCSTGEKTSPSRSRASSSESAPKRSARNDDIDARYNTASAENAGEMLYQGIAARAFERRFQLADHVEVKAATLANGLLHVDLVREIPEQLKPRQIPIGTSAASAKVIDAKTGEAKAA